MTFMTSATKTTSVLEYDSPMMLCSQCKDEDTSIRGLFEMPAYLRKPCEQRVTSILEAQQNQNTKLHPEAHGRFIRLLGPLLHYNLSSPGGDVSL
jgi:hypothetical protein